MNRDIILLLTATLTASFAQVFLKYGATSFGRDFFNHPTTSQLLKIATNLPIIFGLGMYVIATYFTIVVLTSVPLSTFAFFTSASYIIILIASYYLFNDPLTITKLAGCGMIIVGVFFVVRG